MTIGQSEAFKNQYIKVLKSFRLFKETFNLMYVNIRYTGIRVKQIKIVLKTDANKLDV